MTNNELMKYYMIARRYHRQCYMYGDKYDELIDDEGHETITSYCNNCRKEAMISAEKHNLSKYYTELAIQLFDWSTKTLCLLGNTVGVQTSQISEI